MVIISILIVVCYAILVRMLWVIHDNIDLLENNLKEIAKSQSGIRESIDKIEMDLCQIVCTIADIEDNINELKK
jgi:peptidoglycan hydrolase CwlO-like protein